MSFVHLHNHSHYSILKGLPKPKDYVDAAKLFGMNAVALTDTNNIHGCHEFYTYAKSQNIKPILGTEVLLASNHQDEMMHTLVLLAKNLNGYRNIIALLSHAQLSNSQTTPHITFEDLKKYSNDLIALSGPIDGEIPSMVLLGKSDEEIYAKIQEYEALFPGDFYVELLYHDDIPKQRFVTDHLIQLHKQYHFPVVATQNTFYIKKEDKHTQDIIMALGTGHQIEYPDRPTLINGDYSFLSGDEMEEQFGFLPQALSNTQVIADKIDIEIPMGKILIPHFELPPEDEIIYQEALLQEKDLKDLKVLSSDEWYLRYLSFVGLNNRYDFGLSQTEILHLVRKLDKPGLQKPLTESSPEELKKLSLTFYTPEKIEFLKKSSQSMQDKIERLEYELEVVHEMGFDAYFLIVADYIGWARKNSIPVGPGRGSAAGSLMAYCTGITDIDPLPYGLLFERFLNPARISMPDIDTDFADDGRDKVIDYCRRKYGEDHVAQICTFGTFAARAAVKDVGRVLGFSFQEMNELAKLIPFRPGIKLKDALEEPELKTQYETNAEYKNIIDNALKIEGNVRQIGVHACAVIIAPKPMIEYTALQHPPKDAHTIITQYSAYPLEDLGLLKMDFLGLSNLTIIKRALKIIKNNKNIDLDISKIPLDDVQTFKIFQQGDTTGVFQFESPGMRKYLVDLVPNRFEDIIAMVALYRPGPMAYIPSYVERKHGREEVKYMSEKLIEILKKAGYSQKEIEAETHLLNTDLAPILDVSRGIAIYQEQLMFIVQVMAGFSLGEADLLRRGVGKKIKEVIEKLKVEFIKKAVDFRGYKPETPRYIYEEMIEPAANYSFNKSHAACYALIAYQTAYLKTYYRSEFMTSLMVNDEQNLERIMMEIAEANMSGIEVLPPSVNQSLKHFTYVDDHTIRFGLHAIKGVGEGPVRIIKSGRGDGKYESLEDFIQKTGREVMNKKTLEALILSGSLDAFGKRGILFKNIDNILSFSRHSEKQLETNQIGLFDHIEGENTLTLTPSEPFTYEEILDYEREYIGFPISGHPLDGLQPYINKRNKNTSIFKKTISEYEALSTSQQNKISNTTLQVVGYIQDVRKITTRSGGTMLFLSCESFDFPFEVLIFPKNFDETFQKLKSLVSGKMPVVEDFIGKMIFVQGRVQISAQYNRKTLLAQTTQFFTLTHIRNQAKEHKLLNDKKFAYRTEFQEEKIIDDTDNPGSDTDTVSPDENMLAEKLQERAVSILPPKYEIHIPSMTQKENLTLLKQLLTSLPTGDTHIYLVLKGQTIDTQLKVNSLTEIFAFEHKYFQKQPTSSI